MELFPKFNNSQEFQALWNRSMIDKTKQEERVP